MQQPSSLWQAPRGPLDVLIFLNIADLHYVDGTPLTVQYVLVVDALNFCFWPGTYTFACKVRQHCSPATSRKPEYLGYQYLHQYTVIANHQLVCPQTQLCVLQASRDGQRSRSMALDAATGCNL